KERNGDKKGKRGEEESNQHVKKGREAGRRHVRRTVGVGGNGRREGHQGQQEEGAREVVFDGREKRGKKGEESKRGEEKEGRRKTVKGTGGEESG
ncbi:hypothetical protein, partial [Burkholderia pseudomallei]|uniref:hypothetical protein n=1 Tax=Burkholderia pseudomallei TaxID=28450 RepID=UPI0021F7F1E2